MKKYFLATILFWVTSAIAAPSITPVAPKLVDGCYQIGTAAELYGFAAITNGTDGMTRNTAACGKLTADIVVNQNVLVNDTLNGDGSNFVPWTPIEEFSGTFDGQFHTISGLYYSYKIDDQEEHNWAAFILSARPAREGDTVFIRNLGIEDSYIFNYRYAAGILGSIDTGTIAMENVYYASWVYGYYDTPAGLIGDANKGPLYVKNSYALVPEPMIRKVSLIEGAYSETRAQVVNCFGSSELNLYTGTNERRMAYKEFLNGSVAVLLHTYPEGSIWGQNVGVDKHPVFSGKVTNYAGDRKISKLTLHAESEHEPYPEIYMEGMFTPLPIPPKEGHAFIGWYSNADFIGDTTMVISYKDTSDKEFFARWEPLPKLVDNCYQIGTVGELYGFAAIVNGTNGTPREQCACGKLTADIIISDTLYRQGDRQLWFPMTDYCGTFDGNGKTISGLVYVKNKGANMGFFGSTRSFYVSYQESYSPVIKDLSIVKSYYDGDECVGVMIGKGSDTDIINCYAEGTVYARYGVGALAGCLSGSNITHSISNAIGNGLAGGGSFIGVSQGGIYISNSYNKGNVSCGYAEDRNPIGFVGRTDGSTTIENCYHKPRYSWNRDSAALIGDYGSVNAINAFYDGTRPASYGTHVTTREFNDGSVAKLLREYKSDSVDGSIWGQRVGIDDAPIFTDKFTFSDVIIPATPKMSEGCYQIGTVEELFGFANIVNSSLFNFVPFCAKLTSDIVLNENLLAEGNSDIEWIPIRDFDGEFDGQGHTISGIYFNDTSVTNAGLFASVINRDSLYPATIKNLKIADTYIRGGLNTGALIGKIDTLSQSVTIENCQVEAYVGNSYIYNTTQYRGGLVGFHHGKKLAINQTSGTIEFFGNGTMAGFVAHTRGILDIVNSYNITTVPFAYAYGFVGSAKHATYWDTTAIIHAENSFAITKDTAGEWYYMPHVYADRGVPISYKNVFYLEYEYAPDTSDQALFSATKEQFRNGTVASALRMHKSETADGSVWGQTIGVDEYPKLTGAITGVTAVKISPLNLVTYDSDTATYIDDYVEGVKTELPIPVRKDYTFRGWFIDSEFSGTPIAFIPKDATGEQTFYAKWWHIPDLVDNCYEIGDVGELYQFAEDYNNDRKHPSICVKLTKDIVINKNVLVEGELNETDSASFTRWTPIEQFRGIFDGQGHSISGLFFTGYKEGVGLFGSIGNKDDTTVTTIKNLAIKDSYFNGYKYVGSLVGITNGSMTLSIINVSSESRIYGDAFRVGGIIGEFNYHEDDGNYLNLINVRNEGAITGYQYVGGIAGSINHAKTTIINASSTGEIRGYAAVGGIVGEIFGGDSSSIAYSFNEGPVTATAQVPGGLVAYTFVPLLTIYNSYNVGDIYSRDTIIGGIVGLVSRPLALINSFNKGSLPEDTTSDALAGYLKKNVTISVDNVFYLNTASTKYDGIAATADEFTDLSLAKKLHDYDKGGIDGTAWGQEAGDAYPTFKADIVSEYVARFLAAHSDIENPDISSSSTAESSSSSSDVILSSSEESSSSSSVILSSSEESSSSEKSSSSSSVILSSSEGSSSSEKSSSSSSVILSSSEGSSSSEKSSSSSSVILSSSEGSSSSEKSSSSAKSSSSQKQAGIVAGIDSPVHFDVIPIAGHILISGAPAGAKVSLLDMQGRILYHGHIESQNTLVKAPNTGLFIVRVQNTNKIVKTGP